MLRAGFAALAIVLLVACNDDDTEPTPAATGQPPNALEVSSGDPDPLSPGEYTSRLFTPTPTFTVGEGWASSLVDTQIISLARDITADSDCLCILVPDSVYDPATASNVALPKDLTEWFALNPGLVTSNPSSLQVGNRAARQMETTVAEGAALVGGRLPLVSAGENTYSLAPGEKGHIIVIDHPDGSIVLGIRAPLDVYADFFRQSEPVVGSLIFAD